MATPSLKNVIAALEGVPENDPGWMPSKMYAMEKITSSHHRVEVRLKVDGSRRLYAIDAKVAKTPWVEIP